jgi:hypothetical protein
MDHTIDMREDILKQRIDDVAHNMRIPRDPAIIGRVGNLYLLLVSILSINKLGGARLEPSSSLIMRAPQRVGRN